MMMEFLAFLKEMEIKTKSSKKVDKRGITVHPAGVPKFLLRKKRLFMLECYIERLNFRGEHLRHE